MSTPTPEIRKARAVSGFVDTPRLRENRLCGTVRFESTNGRPLGVVLVPVVRHADRWLLQGPDGQPQPRPCAEDIQPALGRIGHVRADTVPIEVPWPSGPVAEAILLLLHAQIEGIGDPEFGLARMGGTRANRSKRCSHVSIGPGSPQSTTDALRTAIARCLGQRPASELDLAVIRRPAAFAHGGPETTARPAPPDHLAPDRWPAFALGSCQYPAGLIDGSVNLRHAVRSEADIGPADRSLWRLAARCEADHSIDAVVLAGDLVYVDATAGLFDPKSQLDALDFAYGRLRDNRALDRIKRLGVEVFTLMDDHEIRDNYGGEPGELDAARRRYLNSQRTMWPPPAHSPGAPLWTSRQVAGHPCFLADTRSEREARTLANWRDARIYSPAQSTELRQWIAAQSGTGRPAFVVTSSMLLPRPIRLRDGAAALALQADAWCGYPASLHELLAWIHDQRACNIVFLSGDEHLSSLARITLYDGEPGRAPLTVYSIHSSALYAPFPFANSHPQDFASADRFEFDVPGAGGARTLACTVEVLDWVPGDGHALIRPVETEEGWRIDVSFDRVANGTSAGSREHQVWLDTATAFPLPEPQPVRLKADAPGFSPGAARSA